MFGKKKKIVKILILKNYFLKIKMCKKKTWLKNKMSNSPLIKSRFRPKGEREREREREARVSLSVSKGFVVERMVDAHKSQSVLSWNEMSMWSLWNEILGGW